MITDFKTPKKKKEKERIFNEMAMEGERLFAEQQTKLKKPEPKEKKSKRKAKRSSRDMTNDFEIASKKSSTTTTTTTTTRTVDNDIVGETSRQFDELMTDFTKLLPSVGAWWKQVFFLFLSEKQNNDPHAPNVFKIRKVDFIE
jgi:chromatin segregation and condensation protein Rec8/ScpA/Scc1 (kleisin family)